MRNPHIPPQSHRPGHLPTGLIWLQSVLTTLLPFYNNFGDLWHFKATGFIAFSIIQAAIISANYYLLAQLGEPSSKRRLDNLLRCWVNFDINTVITCVEGKTEAFSFLKVPICVFELRISKNPKLESLKSVYIGVKMEELSQVWGHNREVPESSSHQQTRRPRPLRPGVRRPGRGAQLRLSPQNHRVLCSRGQ